MNTVSAVVPQPPASYLEARLSHKVGCFFLLPGLSSSFGSVDLEEVNDQ
jgi:hypothetical protein